MRHPVDYIIVGQGLAGTVLAHFLIKNNHSILVIDNHHHKSSSLLAAGTFNPAVFRRLGLIWKAQELMDFSIPFYRNLEKELNTNLVKDLDVLKVLSDEKEKENWEKFANIEKYKQYFKAVYDSSVYSGLKEHNHGLGKLSCTGTVNLGNLLNVYKQELIQRQALIKEKFDFEKLVVEEQHVQYGSFQARRIIFCEGHQAIHNPYFSWLPFNLTKGEILHIDANVSKDHILHKRINVIPQEDGHFWVGSNFEWKYEHHEPTKSAEKELTGRLNDLIGNDYQVTAHQAGIRPTVSDRRPLIGVHPEKDNVFIFNGLGTRGVLMAPYFANQMVGYLNQREKLDPEVDIKRYASAHQC